MSGFTKITVPPKQRNPYTIWYKYSNKKVNTFNRITIKYNMEKLQPPVNIKK
jgi:hypothetical protein